MRLKIIDKSGQQGEGEDELSLNQKLSESTSITTLNAVKTEKITFQPNGDKGYSIICEAILPYDVFAVTFDLEMITNHQELELERVEMLESLTYTDVYTPYKYGIIFKEKIYVGQQTSAAMSIILKRKEKVRTPKTKETESKENPPKEDQKEEEQEYGETEQIVELQKNFKVEIFDNGELLNTYNGNGHLTISHFNFRSNAGLEERPKVEAGAPPANSENEPVPDKEYKHYYVIQATFDKSDWKESIIKDIPETQGISWELKVCSSDTLAVVKDTDKEDREQALKDSWEAAEPGRAEKSRKSRIRYIATLKQQKGEELTEEEKEVLNEKRVRGAANLNEVVIDPKAAKGKVDKKGAPPVEEENKQEEVVIVYPKSSDYTNLHYREFIHHFESDRLIHVKCNKSSARLRDEREIEQRQKEREEEVLKWQEVPKWEEVFNAKLQNGAKDRVQEITTRESKEFIESITQLLSKRNEYRELISNRKYKEILLTDIMNSEKIDIAALEQALNDAKSALVRQVVLEGAEKKLEVLKYSKGIEEQLQAASGEKNAERMRELIAQIENENLIIEPKILNDCKNALSKMK